MATIDRHCIRCGEPGPFRNDLALRCKACDSEAGRQRKNYHRIYQAARTRAIRELVRRHRAEFDGLMEEYRATLEAKIDTSEIYQTTGSDGCGVPAKGADVNGALAKVVATPPAPAPRAKAAPVSPATSTGKRVRVKA